MMKKWVLIGICVILGLSLGSCKEKTVFDLKKVEFVSFFVGNEQSYQESRLIPLNTTDAKEFRTVFQVNSWSPLTLIDASSLTLSGLVLVDAQKNQYVFYQITDKIIIKVLIGQNEPIYYERDGVLSQILAVDLRIPIHTSKLKALVRSRFFNKAEADLSRKSVFSGFALSVADSDELKALMNIDQWNLVNTDLTDEPESQMKIYSMTSDLDLGFALQDQGNTGLIIIHHYENGIDLYDVFSIARPQFLRILTKITDTKLLMHPLPSKEIQDAIYTDVKIYYYDQDAPISDYHLSASDSEVIKPQLMIQDWVKLDNSGPMTFKFMTLRSTTGLFYTFGDTEVGSIVIVTSEADASFKEIYGLSNPLQSIVKAFFSYDPNSKPIQTMLDFKPVKLTIMDSWDDQNGAILRSYDLTNLQSNDLKAILNIQNWIKSANPDRYAFGWTFSFSLQDAEGRNMNVYNYFTDPITAIHIDGFFPEQSDWVWYEADHAIISALQDYTASHFPKP